VSESAHDQGGQAACSTVALFPGPTKEFEAHREIYGDTSRLSANQFFYGLRYGDEHRIQIDRGVDLIIGLAAISEPDERGMRTVMCILNGKLRPVVVRDESTVDRVAVSATAQVEGGELLAVIG
jgi:pyruvate carboxylase